MPGLSTDMHTAMLRQFKRADWLPVRLARAVKRAWPRGRYGDEWGVIADVPPLQYFLEQWVKPYVNAAHTALEIGPGGGRWTQHLSGFRQLWLVDYHEELLNEIRRVTRRQTNCVYVRNNGSDFPGVADGSIDFCFSFGVFVHLDFEIIEDYLDNLTRIMRPGGTIVIQFADKRKTMAKANTGFAENDPARMHAAIASRGFEIVEADDTLFWHSAVVRFTKPGIIGTGA